MRLLLAVITTATFMWLAVMVTIAAFVVKHIVAVSVLAAVCVVVILAARARRRRAHRQPLPRSARVSAQQPVALCRAHVVARSR